MQKIAELNAVFVDCAAAFRCQSPVSDQLFATENAKHCVRISNVDCEEHATHLNASSKGIQLGPGEVVATSNEILMSPNKV